MWVPVSFRWGSETLGLLQVFQLAVLFVAGKAADLIVVINEHYMRSVRWVGELFRGHLAVVHDDYLVAYGYQVCGGTVQADYATAWLAGDNVGFQAVAVVAVGNGNQLVFLDAGCFHQLRVDGDGADVIKFRLGNGCTMNFALKHIQQHKVRTFLLRVISLVVHCVVSCIHAVAYNLPYFCAIWQDVQAYSSKSNK